MLIIKTFEYASLDFLVVMQAILLSLMNSLTITLNLAITLAVFEKIARTISIQASLRPSDNT